MTNRWTKSIVVNAGDSKDKPVLINNLKLAFTKDES